jgi:CheY-like chemotaxis protein
VLDSSKRLFGPCHPCRQIYKLTVSRLMAAQARQLHVSRSEVKTVQTPLPVLVVDDNPLNRSVATEFIRVLGHDAYEAVDGVDALEKWEQHAPVLILMDLNMPRLNGLLATLKIRQREAALRRHRASIYMWTASGHVSEADRHRIGADGALSKPLLLEELRCALAAHSSPGHRDGG